MTDLKAIQERAEKATKGRWRGSGNLGHQLSVKSWELIANFNNQSFQTLGRITHSENLQFIAHAREDIPMLLKALAEARGKVMLIDASPAGSLNAQLKMEALAILGGSG